MDEAPTGSTASALGIMLDAPPPVATNGNGKDAAASSVTMRWTALSAVWGIVLLGTCCVFVEPHYPAGVTLVLATLTGLVGGIVGGKLGLAKPTNGASQ